MPIDSNIYFQNKGIDFGRVLDSYDKGIDQKVKMSDLAKKQKQEQQEQDKRNAYQAGFKKDANGNMVFDQNIAMSKLAEGGFGDSAYALQNEIEQRNQAKAQQEIENQQKERHNRILEQQSAIDNLYKKAQIESLKEKTNGASNEGFKAADKDYAKDYNTFTSKGAVNAKSSIERLKQIASELENKTGIFDAGGGRASVLPDFMRDQDSIRMREGAKNAANSTLKDLFGGQLSDGERTAAAQEYYNDKLSNAENAKILRDKIAQLESGYQSELQKAEFFKNYGTLKGFQPQGLNEPLKEDKDIIKPTPKIEKPDANTRIIDGVIHRKVQGGWLPASN